MDEHPRQAQSLRHPARERIDEGVLLVLEVRQFEHVADHFFALAAGDAVLAISMSCGMAVVRS